MEDIQVLEAMENARIKWTRFFGEEQAKELAGWIEETDRGDPKAVEQAATQVLDLVEERYKRNKQIYQELGLERPKKVMRGRGSSTIGGPGSVRATTMVCPIDPANCPEQVLQFRPRKPPTCPNHVGTALVPKDSLPGKE